MSDRWYKNHRMEWIAEMLRVYGFINREHIQRKFGLSTPQASKDLNDFMRLHPDAASYNLSAKRYEGKHAKSTITLLETPNGCPRCYSGIWERVL